MPAPLEWRAAGPRPRRDTHSYAAVTQYIRGVIAETPGSSLRTFALAAGVNERTLRNIMASPSLESQVRDHTYAKITSVRAGTLARDPGLIIDGTESSARVQHLISMGHNTSEISNIAGLQATTLRPTHMKTLRADTAAAIEYAYRQVLKTRQPELVPSCAVTRRVDALRVLGWPVRLLSEKTGVARLTLTPRSARPLMKTQRSTRAAVARVYAELKFKPGPSQKTARYAQSIGCAPWSAWEFEGHMDDPRRRPDYSFVEDAVWAAAIQRRYEMYAGEEQR